MRILVLTALLFTTEAFACWKLQGLLSVDKNSVKVNQKVEHGKTYSFPKGSFIYNVTVASNRVVSIDVVEKVGLELRPRTTAQVLVKEGQEAVFSQETEGTHQLTKMKLTLTEI